MKFNRIWISEKSLRSYHSFDLLINIKNLLNLKQLELIDFSNNKCKEVAKFIANNCENFPNPKEFNFAYNNMGIMIGSAIISGLSDRAKNLEYINLSGNNLKRIESNLKDLISKNVNVKFLDLSNNEIDPIVFLGRPPPEDY